MNSGRLRPRGRRLAAGERVLLVDRKDRRYLVTLRPGRSFQSHAGVIEHDGVIGRFEGEELEAHQRDGRVTSSARYLVLRPTLADVVVGMPRGAQVIYPKDLGAILIAADIFPGARVLEAGVGSGALSMAMLRAGAVITGYELRADFAERARANVEAFLGPDQPYSVLERDVYLGIDAEGLDRVVLDLAEPWQVVPHAERALAPGGIFLAYLPTINQTAELRGVWSRADSPWRRLSRSCDAPGTSKGDRSGPTTAWSRTPASSPRRACCSPERALAPVAGACRVTR